MSGHEETPLRSHSSSSDYGANDDHFTVAIKDHDIQMESKGVVHINSDHHVHRTLKRSLTVKQISADEQSRFTIIAISMQVLIMCLYGLAVEYEAPNASLESGQQDIEDVSNYVFFQQINVMMLIGFGYLMTFLRRYGYGAVTFNFMLTVLCIEWGLLVVGLIDIVFGAPFHRLNIGINNLAQGDIAAAVILISFGGILGRASPSQLLIMGFLEIICYAVNMYIVTDILHVTDVGGSIIVHTFGAYFGLAVSYIIGPPDSVTHLRSSANSDLFSMIGTLFLWLYWPSFNGIFPQTFKSSQFKFSQVRCFVNTILSLCSCTLTTVATAFYVEGGKINIVYIQNSTLAGGVAVGAAANLYLTPCGAMIVGFVAAIISVLGFRYLQDWVQDKFNLYDSCGIHNLHGMPGILGGIVSAIAIAAANASSAYSQPEAAGFYYDSFEEQAGYQIVGILVTLGISIPTGIMTGLIVTKIPFFSQKALAKYSYVDGTWFIVPDPDKIH